MTTETVSNAVAQRDNSPAGLIKQYSTSFAQVLPSHIKAETWVRLAQGALKRGKRIEDAKSPQRGMFVLEVAAANNPGKFLAALLDAARLGLEPGTEGYYLTPRKVKGKLEILGIVGYQGYIELMYRAGAVSSIVAEVVRQHDQYEFVAGQLDRQIPPRWQGPQEIPWHQWPPFAGEATRGGLLGVYAYARMKDSAVSRVVQLGAEDIARIKASAEGSTSEYSPWVNHEAAMWLKSGVRQLQKWVPTSAEFRMEIARAIAEANRVATSPEMPAGVELPLPDLDGEVVDDPAAEDWPATTEPGSTDANA
jgi:recombination protein RecT